MNIFVIPSWFPSKDRPVSGTMIKEQTEAFCKYYPEVHVGISNWGQMEEGYLLWSKDHVKNIRKLIKAKPKPFTATLLPNLKVYHSFAYTWTSKFLGGNMAGIVQANIKNLKTFEADFGPVDIIHAHAGYPAGMIAMEVAKRQGIPFCVTEHMGPFPRPQTQNSKGMLSEHFKQPYINAAANIAVSPFQAEVMQKQGIDKIATIPNCVDEEFFRPSPLYQFHPNPFTFFTLSYISSGKGIDILLQAVKILTEIHKNVLFKIAGSSPYIHQYKKMSAELGIDDYVEWLGEINREEAIDEYQLCDAFILPSLYESMGVVYVEALACGKPIIATRCGGPETTVTPFNGLITEKNNVEKLVSMILKMIEERSNYDSSKIRADFLERFSTKAIAPKLFALYCKIVRDNNVYTQEHM